MKDIIRAMNCIDNFLNTFSTLVRVSRSMEMLQSFISNTQLLN